MLCSEADFDSCSDHRYELSAFLDGLLKFSILQIILDLLLFSSESFKMNLTSYVQCFVPVRICTCTV